MTLPGPLANGGSAGGGGAPDIAAGARRDTVRVPPDVLQIAETLEGAGFEAWCVGGALRDHLLGIEETDFDLATSARPEDVQRLFPRTVAVGIKYGTVGVLDRRRRVHEVTTFRRDVRTDGRHAEVVFGVSLLEDLSRRDFTINAMAFHPLRREWQDPFQGIDDIGRQRVRAVGEPAQRFREDYLRILRAIRFAARFDFTIDGATWDAARAASPGLAGLSAERVREEWFKGLRSTRSIRRLVGQWWKIGAAEVWLPELVAAGEVGVEHPGRLPGGGAGPDPVVLTVLLCRDPIAVLTRLKASNAEIGRAVAMVTGPGEPEGGSLDPRAVRRWLAAVGEAAGDLALLWRLRHEGAPWPWEGVVGEIRERGDPIRRGDLAVSGSDLVAAGVPAGPAVGRMLERLLARVVDDPSLNTREALLALARSPR